MQFLKKSTLVLFLFLLSGLSGLMAQTTGKAANPWNDFGEANLVIQHMNRRIIPMVYRTVSLDFEGFKTTLDTAPMKFSAAAADKKIRITLPMPDGTSEIFEIVKAPILHPDLAARFPEIQSFAGKGMDDPTAYVRLDFTLKGFHAMILSGRHSTVFIDPYAEGDTEHYISYFKKDFVKQNTVPFQCGVEGNSVEEGIDDLDYTEAKTLLAGDCILRKYRLALACTGEYAQYHGGTIPSVLSAMNTTMTRVIGVYERDAAITMELIPNTDELIFFSASTDPYTNNNGNVMLDQNQETVDNIIGSANYDIGHVFSTGGGGIASLNSPCSPNRKAQGVTGLSNPIGDPFDIDYVAHEMGHQYGGNHTQNNDCQRNSDTAVEPGSASSIMGYAGICPPNVQPNSDDLFHIINLREIAQNVTFGTSSTCYESLVSENTPPTAYAGLDYTIPVGTPFELIGTADDEEDPGSLTSTWEQMDSQVATMPPSGNSAGGPLFRSVNLTASPSRVFPRLFDIVNNQNPTWEVLPQVARTMKFTFSVRDNQLLHGCTADDDMVVTVSDAGGPFLVTAPNTGGLSYEVNESVEVTWDVANTTVAPINCAFVNVKLSVDGGFTYPYLLAYHQPNNGSTMVTIPNVLTNQARVKVESFENVFFDISNQNFAIVPATVPGFTVEVGPFIQQVCTPALVDIHFETDSLVGFTNEVHFELVAGLPDEVASYAQNPIVPGQDGTFSLDLGTEVPSGSYEVILQATAAGADTTYRSFILEITRSDFSDLAMATPVNGENGIILGADFSWNPIEDADTYDLEISTSPLFGDSVIISAFGLMDTLLTPAEFFEPNHLFFWRIRAINTCGPGPWLDPFAFQTVTTSCETYTPDDLPKNISGSGLPTIESKLFIESSGIISDVNIPYMQAVYQPVNSLRITLISPAGTEVVLFDQNCGNTLNLRIGFDDDSPFNITCPPDDGIVFRPVESLSAFEGEDIQGEWTMRVKVVESGFGASGALEEWSIEFCAAGNSTESPYVVTNDTLYVPPAGFNYITQNELEVDDPDSDNLFFLEYTILSLPAEGTLYYIDEPLGVGDVFRQTAVNANYITYVHDGGEEVYDHFNFLVRDGQGGLSPTQVFNIKIDENATVGIAELVPDFGVTVFPNPAEHVVFVHLDTALEGMVKLNLFDVDGRMLLEKESASLRQFSLGVEHLVPGIYFLNVQTTKGVVTKKIVVSR